MPGRLIRTLSRPVPTRRSWDVGNMTDDEASSLRFTAIGGQRGANDYQVRRWRGTRVKVAERQVFARSLFAERLEPLARNVLVQD